MQGTPANLSCVTRRWSLINRKLIISLWCFCKLSSEGCDGTQYDQPKCSGSSSLPTLFLFSFPSRRWECSSTTSKLIYIQSDQMVVRLNAWTVRSSKYPTKHLTDTCIMALNSSRSPSQETSTKSLHDPTVSISASMGTFSSFRWVIPLFHSVPSHCASKTMWLRERLNNKIQ